MTEVETAVYQAVIGECERLERDGSPVQGHHLARRLASLVALSGRLVVREGHTSPRDELGREGEDELETPGR